MAPKHLLDTAALHVVGRRDALRTLTAGVAVAACGELRGGHDAAGVVDPDAGGSADVSDAQTADVRACAPLFLALGAVTNYPIGTWVLNRDDRNNPVVVGHDASGYYVFTAICPHDFCEIDPPAPDGQSVCRCHVSYFDGNGGRISGPSPGPLVHFAAAVCDGMLTADPNVLVAPETRTPG